MNSDKRAVKTALLLQKGSYFKKMEAVSIRKSYGKKKVLTDVSFVAEKGKCTGFIGANGCGKSTLFRILSGVERADGGSISIDGSVLTRPVKELPEYVGYIPQENALLKELTVKDNLRLFAALSKENGRRLEMLCHQFSIKEFEREKVENLSGGMQKRVNIVCALLGNPQILIMDEPSASLDLVFKEELKGYVEAFTKAGGSVLLSSHDRGEILRCDRLFAIKDGVATEVEPGLSVEKMVSEYMAKKSGA